MAEGVPDPVRKVPFIELVLIDDAKVVICAGQDGAGIQPSPLLIK